MTAQAPFLSPALLAAWTRCVRESNKWSQEALAAAAGLDARTIQRIEAGHPTSITTRRSLAKGLGYEDIKVFEKPEFAIWVTNFFDEIDKAAKSELQERDPECIPVKVSHAVSGQMLALLAGANAYHFNYDEDLSPEAKQKAAHMFDLMRDWGDGYDDVSYSHRLTFEQELGAALGELEQLGAWAYSGVRNTNIVGENWVNKSPMSITIGYLALVKKGKAIERIMISRKLS